jgi:hypothetical protein
MKNPAERVTRAPRGKNRSFGGRLCALPAGVPQGHPLASDAPKGRRLYQNKGKRARLPAPRTGTVPPPNSIKTIQALPRRVAAGQASPLQRLSPRRVAAGQASPLQRLSRSPRPPVGRAQLKAAGSFSPQLRTVASSFSPPRFAGRAPSKAASSLASATALPRRFAAGGKLQHSLLPAPLRGAGIQAQLQVLSPLQVSPRPPVGRGARARPEGSRPALKVAGSYSPQRRGKLQVLSPLQRLSPAASRRGFLQTCGGTRAQAQGLAAGYNAD